MKDRVRIWLTLTDAEYVLAREGERKINEHARAIGARHKTGEKVADADYVGEATAILFCRWAGLPYSIPVPYVRGRADCGRNVELRCCILAWTDPALGVRPEELKPERLYVLTFQDLFDQRRFLFRGWMRGDAIRALPLADPGRRGVPCYSVPPGLLLDFDTVKEHVIP